MRLSPIVLALAATASARNVFRSGGQSLVKRDDNLKVPGENPLQFCNADRDEDLITIDEVTLSPNPPAAGTTLNIEASGTVNETILKGAYVKLEVKYGYIRLISTTADLCEQLGNVDLECPIEPGKLSITKTVDLPSQIPPGKYTVLADVYNDDDVHITCLTATVTFGGKSLGGMVDL
ncbi:ML domain-containing protein [Chaetomium fimeti]|jgi:hypothetical protein|uniref:Phosphatidylglycerol/phosphatidylinositol transfer protein n=1 Tax=Chaetomium fimeti TaxID=1854472 RepID=A0AAE0H947_9PEZI|nr:ML domain-containing protein [Chaetomium fimeti]